jgi:ribosomal protein S18 acetylase RimI-like enzyme
LPIRYARDSDAADLARLAGELGYPSTSEQILARKRELEREGKAAIFVAEDGAGAVVGWIQVAEMGSLELDPHAEVKGLVVAEAARSRGIGRELLTAGESWARDRGLREIVLRSNVIRDRAHAFYRAHGYEEQKRQAKFLKRLA